MSGFEVLEKLRGADTTRLLPVIIHTSRVLEEAERQRLSPQTTAILSKEAPSREFAMARLRDALGKAVLGVGSAREDHA
jgi:CheY-like chemotaxis protein